MNSFRSIREKAINNERKTIVVAAAEDEDVLEALKNAKELFRANTVLIGNKTKIVELAEKIGFDISAVPIVNEPDQNEAARKAVVMVRRGEAHILMKGLIGTDVLLKAVLDKEIGLGTGRVLSHVAVFEVPQISRLLLITDCAINIVPDLKEKIQIIENAVELSKKLGISKPKAAVVCAVENVNPAMPATLDAALLAKMNERGQLKGVLVDGPLALDIAVSRKAAEHKGIISPVAGEADIILVPNLEAGNIMYKTLVYLSETHNAGVVMGATAPVVLTSRSDSAESKLNSIALSLLIA